MQIVSIPKIAASLIAALTIQVAAFVVFHLSMALVFEIEWVKLTLDHRWLGTVNWLLKDATLYVPVALFIWLIFKPRYSKPLLALMAAVTLYCAYYFSYPVLTGFLYALGQIDRWPTFLFDHMPGIDQYPPL